MRKNALANYLSDTDTELKMLSKYICRIKTVFMKYNTTLPSSTPVEILLAELDKLTDSMFEKLLLLKVNQK